MELVPSTLTLTCLEFAFLKREITFYLKFGIVPP